jgi:hypothetical protein
MRALRWLWTTRSPWPSRVVAVVLLAVAAWLFLTAPYP